MKLGLRLICIAIGEQLVSLEVGAEPQRQQPIVLLLKSPRTLRHHQTPDPLPPLLIANALKDL